MVQVYVNYWAVIAAAIANMALGFAWYGPMFGKWWSAWSGHSAEKIEAMKAQAQGGMWKTYALAFIGSLLMAYVLRHSIVFAGAYLEITGAAAGLQAGFWSWLGFVAPVTLGTVLWEDKPWKLWILTNAYYLAALIVMGIIVAVWA